MERWKKRKTGKRYNMVDSIINYNLVQINIGTHLYYVNYSEKDRELRGFNGTNMSTKYIFR